MRIFLFILLFTNYALSNVSLHEDEFYKYQWGLHNTGRDIEHKVSDIDNIIITAKENEDINLPQHYQSTREIKVAVIDSGIDLNHPDLRDIISRNQTECVELEKFKACLNNEAVESCNTKFARIDTNNNGYPLDCQGWNFAAPVNEYTKIQGNNNTQDLIGHGSFVSGIIAGKKNSYGIEGISQNVRIIPIKVSGSDQEVNLDNSTDIFARGIEYAIKANADIINLSVGWGFNQNSILVTQAIQKAIAKNILVVVAAGNASHSSLSYPCALNEVICVGSHNPDGNLSHFSNKGSSVDILAPGFKILSSWPLELRSLNFTQRTGYEYKDGTSFSAPFVVGALARLLELGYTPEESKLKLYTGARNNKSKGLVLNGNLDVTAAINAKLTSFIYPLKKTPAIINWDKEDKRIKLIYKNYNEAAKNIQITLLSSNLDITIKDATLKFDEWKKDEIKELYFNINGPKVVDSELDFKVNINSEKEKKSYPLQVIASTIIHENFKRDDANFLKGSFKPNISNRTIRAFENISPFAGSDYLVINDSGKTVSWSLLKNKKSILKLSPAHKTDLDKALIPHLARIDIDQDGSEDYVIFAYKQDKELNWLVKIFIYDENFKRKEYALNNNQIKSNITTLNTSVKWTKINNEIVPIWISNGYIPVKDLAPVSPWEMPTVNSYQQRLYYLSKERLHYYPIQLDDTDEDIFPKTFFPQTKYDKQIFNLKVLGFNKDQFLKDYYLFKINSKEQPTKLISDSFIDIFESPSYLTKSGGPAIFNFYDPTKKHTILTNFSQKSIKIQNLAIPFKTDFDSIQAIIPNKNISDGVFTLTKYNILFYENGRLLFSENRNISNQISYHNIKNNSLYLSSNDSPGLTSELISFRKNKLTKPSNYRFLKFGSCIELELTYNIWIDQHQANFYCDKNKKFIKINL